MDRCNEISCDSALTWRLESPAAAAMMFGAPVTHEDHPQRFSLLLERNSLTTFRPGNRERRQSKEISTWSG